MELLFIIGYILFGCLSVHLFFKWRIWFFKIVPIDASDLCMAVLVWLLWPIGVPLFSVIGIALYIADQDTGICGTIEKFYRKK